MTIDWYKVEFQEFINDFGIELVINKAPPILYSSKDKEHVAYNSLITSLFVAGGLFIYIAISFLLMAIFFSIVALIIVIVIAVMVDVVLIINYIKSNVSIRTMECWVEIFKGKPKDKADNYCLIYYPIFSGKCHPNKAKNVIYKLYQEELLKSRVDITQIEVYIAINKDVNEKEKKIENLGYFFKYGEGKPFTEEKLSRNVWKYFPFEKTLNDNFLAVANWEHQFEWRNDLALDFDKLHSYAPWVIQKWNKINLKPLTDEYKEKLMWNKWYINSTPKLKTWEGNLDRQVHEDKDSNQDLELVEEAIMKIMGDDYRLTKLKDIKEDLFKFKAHFRDLSS